MLKFSRFCPVSLGRPGAEGPTRKRSECFVRVHKEFQRVVFERADFEIVCGGPAESKGAMRRAAGFALTPSQEITVRNRKERNGPGNGERGTGWCCGEERSGLNQVRCAVGGALRAKWSGVGRRGYLRRPCTEVGKMLREDGYFAVGSPQRQGSSYRAGFVCPRDGGLGERVINKPDDVFVALIRRAEPSGALKIPQKCTNVLVSY